MTKNQNHAALSTFTECELRTHRVLFIANVVIYASLSKKHNELIDIALQNRGDIHYFGLYANDVKKKKVMVVDVTDVENPIGPKIMTVYHFGKHSDLLWMGMAGTNNANQILREYYATAMADNNARMIDMLDFNNANLVHTSTVMEQILAGQQNFRKLVFDKLILVEETGGIANWSRLTNQRMAMAISKHDATNYRVTRLVIKDDVIPDSLPAIQGWRYV